MAYITLPAMRFDEVLHQVSMPKAKYDFKLLVDGWNKKTLPLIPTNSLFQPIPLEPDPGVPAADRYTSIHAPTDLSGRKIKPASDRAIDAILTLQKYNRYLGLLQECQDNKQRELSSQFIELGSDVTATIRKANEEVRQKLVEMGQVSQQMFRRLRLEDACFSNGSWSCTFIFEHDIGVRWLIRYEGLTPEELREALKSLPFTGPAALSN